MTFGSYYERIDDHRYKPTPHVSGAWSADEQHFSPLGGLIAHELERRIGDRPGLLLSRISYDILGRPALDECEISVETVRPGRTIELLEAVVRIADRPVVRARAWLLTAVDTTSVAGGPGAMSGAGGPDTAPVGGGPGSTSVDGGLDTAAGAGGGTTPVSGGLGTTPVGDGPGATSGAGGPGAASVGGGPGTSVSGGPGGIRLAPPESLAPWTMSDAWPGGYIASIDVRPLAPPQPGRTTAWVSTSLDLVAGEPSGPVASYLALVDTANGIAVRESPAEWMFPNVDLTIHLHRQPVGPWTGLDTTVTFGPTGQGLTSTVLHDIEGPVGAAQQILTVRPQPGS